jgi:Dyp-type peroxidase family
MRHKGQNPHLVNRKDIQGILASGYDHLDYVRFLFLKIIDPISARKWLDSIVSLITDAEYPDGKKRDTCLNLAFSWKGFEVLGLSSKVQDFSHEYERGMYPPEASLILGDSGEDNPGNPDKWEYGKKTDPLHVLLLLYAKTAKELQSFDQQVCSSNEFRGGLGVVKQQDASRRAGDYTEPFGFRDGISQPRVKGLLGRRQHNETAINTGEFVLGYENELGQLTPIPSVENWADPLGYLYDHPQHPGKRRAFGMNGTYLVFRKLLQKVDSFWKYVDGNSTDAWGAVDRRRRELLAAKMVGRWRSGSPLVLSPEAPGAEPRNDFTFMQTDPDGLACPIGSHIRRANPRDSLDMPPARSILISRRHRLIRRGRKYAEETKDSAADNPKREQGLYFIALNADLRRQFEFVQQLWINNPTFNGLDNDIDPIAGDNDGTGEFTIQAKPISHHLHGLERFVVTKGGGYFFVPGIRAVRFLANYRP